MTDTLCYGYEDGLYLNITNRCDCSCVFCLRKKSKGGGYADNLWLEKEPLASEVIAAVKEYDLKKFKEFFYCGYGEPTMSLDVLFEVAAELK